MKCFYAPAQALHAPETELNRGVLGTPFEAASRPGTVLAALTKAGFGPVEEPAPVSDAMLEKVHDRDFLHFLRTAHDQWLALGREGDALPMCWPGTSMFPPRAGAPLDAQLGYYCFDIMTAITPTSWAAATGSVASAVAAASVLPTSGPGGAFALCRPPGHHAGIAAYGGYSYLNSAAVAAQHLIDQGARRVAILDPDYHHCNGTQQIFYDRADVLYVSIHADPRTDFPYFSGFADEIGRGAGEGFNHNLPLPRGTGWDRWSEALETGIGLVERFAPDALVVSLGVDTLDGDPLCHFRLKTSDFARIGERIARLRLPTAFLMEGGYDLDAVGDNVVQALTGFVDAALA
jgi:acetoin utilization deacetylase AcuC-like enzyme